MATVPTTQLQPGATGASVKQLQDYLVSTGYMTQAQVNTGYGTYGPQTTAAVAKLQKDKGVDNSTGVGYYGPRTIASLSSPATRDVSLGTGTTSPTTITGARNLDSSLPTPPTTPNYPSLISANPSSQAYTQFNSALMGLLKTQQGMGTRGFQEQGFNAQEKQNNTILAPTGADLVGAAPGTQNSVRSNAAEAVQPLVTQAGNATQTFGEQIRSLGDAISSAKSFGDSYMTHQENMQNQARDNITQAMQIGGAQGLEAVKKANPDIFKVAGLDYDSLVAAAKAQEAYTQSKGVEINPGNTLVNPTTGQPIYSNPTTATQNTANGVGGSTGKVATTLAGILSGGTYTSGSLSFTPSQYHQFNDLLTSRTIKDAQGHPNQGTDGYTNPQVYLDAYKAFLAGGGNQADFIKIYPVKTYINPSDIASGYWPEISKLVGGSSTTSRSA